MATLMSKYDEEHASKQPVVTFCCTQHCVTLLVITYNTREYIMIIVHEEIYINIYILDILRIILNEVNEIVYEAHI